jgi:hypothetical protein
VTVLEVLRAARDLIADKDRWTGCGMGEDKEGRLCSIAACGRAGTNSMVSEVAMKRLDRAANYLFPGSRGEPP